MEHKLHRPDHLMYVRTDYDFVIWPDGFTLHDDILLLEVIEIHGIGSWKEIQDYMHRP